jgi:hypothetical protein
VLAHKKTKKKSKTDSLIFLMCIHQVHRDSQAQRVIKESQELLLRVQQAKEEKREHQAVWAEMV